MLLQGYELIKAVYLLLDDGDNQFLGQHNLTQAQFYALLWLADEPKTMTQLSKDMLCDPSNITRVATILERKGLITRQRSQKDRRVFNLALAPAGESLCQEVHQAHDAYTRQRMSTLTPDEQADLLILLEKLSTGLQVELSTQKENTTV